MRLSLYTDYCLRVLIFAAVKGDGLSTISEAAEYFGISRSHLVKVVHELGRKGYLETVRGKKGGFRLRRRPSKIKIGGVVRDSDDRLWMAGSRRGRGYCPTRPANIIRSALREATAAFFGVLDRYTLEDLLAPESSLARRLRHDRPQRALNEAALRPGRQTPLWRPF